VGNLVTKTAIVLILACLILTMSQPVTAKLIVYRASRELVRVQMFFSTFGWNRIQGEHFIVKYQPQDSDIAKMILDLAERNYKPVSERFGRFYSWKIPLIIYPSKESLGRSFGWENDESAMGVYWGGVIRVLSPREWIDSDNPKEAKKIFETEGPIVHEFTHLMVDYVTGGNYTRWFTEGIAQYEEELLTGYRPERRKLTNSDELYKLSRMDGDFDNLADQNLAYLESYQAVKYLVDTYGENKLKEILTCLGKGYSMDDSFRKVLDISYDRLENDFVSWIIQ
jgi:hypothetical protein